MNISASYNWLKEYLEIDVPAEEFASELSLKSMSVESLRMLKEDYANMVIGEIKEVVAHPDADKLKIAKTDVGTEVVDIVCGGKNVAEGMRVLVALPGAKVRWHGEGDLVELKKTKIRGVESVGMICAPEEVGFEKVPCPEGCIWDLTELVDAPAGTSFVEALDMDDVLFDIEITSNRPDAMGMVGLAREAGAATERAFNFTPPTLPSAGEGLPLSVHLEDAELCPRYMAVAMQNIEVKPSPLWLQKKLLLAGFKPINNVVDVTNYILHEYGQPLHAFDYSALKDGEIHIRRAGKGETFLALDETEHELNERFLVIADAERPQAIAGVMGGLESGVKSGTTSIVIEAATFDAVSVRRTARALNLYSQSQTLFEKGLSTEALPNALARAVELMQEIAGGEVASPVLDERAEAYQSLVFPFVPEKARELIGVAIPDEKMIEMLERLGFSVEETSGMYQVTVPYWRDKDVEDSRDFVEEIARLYGYANLPSELPATPPPIGGEDKALVWEEKIKEALVSYGYTECFSYSFISEKDFERYDLKASEAVKIHNPLSSDLTHMRTSLMPSLLRAVEVNQGHDALAKLFELSRIYVPQENGLPLEETELVVVEYGNKDPEQAFRSLKGVAEELAQLLGVKFSYARHEESSVWHPTRTATISSSGQVIGEIGQVHEAVAERFGVDRVVWALRVHVETLVPEAKTVVSHVVPPAFPAIDRDIALLLDEKVAFADLERVVRKADALIRLVELADIYRGKGVDKGQKSVTLSLSIRSDKETLSSEQADEIMKKIADLLEKEFGAILR